MQNVAVGDQNCCSSPSHYLEKRKRTTQQETRKNCFPNSFRTRSLGFLAAFNTILVFLITSSSSSLSSAFQTFSHPGRRRQSQRILSVYPAHQQANANNKKVSMMSAATTKSEETDTTYAGNWRVLPKPHFDDDDHTDETAAITTRAVLETRRAWSDAAYRDSLQLYDNLIQCTDDSYVAGRIQAALTCLDHALRLYGPNSVICSFNGGKDAVVILHLVRAAVAAYYQRQQEQEGDNKSISTTIQQQHQPRVIYFDHADEFPEILEFLHETVAAHDLDMICFARGTKFQDGLRVLVDHNSVNFTTASSNNENTTNTTENNEKVVLLPMAFVLGTRLTDPNAVGQQQFAPSSHYMPPFMRVNPILDWTYGHVWHFLRLFQLPYCRLYDQGYTSLGTVKDTVPCPALAVAGKQQQSSSSETTTTTSGHVPKYWPAYMLREYDQERAGRIVRSKNNKSKGKAKRATTSAQSNNEDSTDIAAEKSASVPSVSSIGHLSTMSEGRIVDKDNDDDDDGKVHQQEDDDDKDKSRSSLDSLGSISSSSDHNNYSSTNNQKTAGILIIGDEILKGFTADTNTQTAATALRNKNVLLKCVVVVSDDLDEIATEIQRLQGMVDIIITSGGVGPTHDDVTMKSVAAALNCEMKLHEEMAQLLIDKMNKTSDADDAAATTTTTKLTDAQIKMATLPTKSKLRYLSKNADDWPVLQCQNIFILPGIPEFFAMKIQNVAEYLSCQLERTAGVKVVLKVDENSIVPVLNQIVAKHPNVNIGSYPFVSHPDYKTVITVEGRIVLAQGGLRSNSKVFDRNMLDLGRPQNKSDAETNVQLAVDDLINRLPDGSVLRVDNDDMTLFS